jgi:hypothetical protein
VKPLFDILSNLAGAAANVVSEDWPGLLILGLFVGFIMVVDEAADREQAWAVALCFMTLAAIISLVLAVWALAAWRLASFCWALNPAFAVSMGLVLVMQLVICVERWHSRWHARRFVFH